MRRKRKKQKAIQEQERQMMEMLPDAASEILTMNKSKGMTAILAASPGDEASTDGQGVPGEKNLYILLSRTGTFPSKVIRFLSHMPYAHASIAFDENLSEMYSFARKKVHYPFYCGLIDEDINKGIFGRKKSTKCLVLRLPVTDEEYDRVHDSVEKFKADRKKYGYNYLGVFAARVHIAIERQYDYFCSQFVDKVLQMSGINLFGKKPGLVTPEDYRTSDKLEHFYEGLLTNYRGWLDSFNLSPEEKSQRKLEKNEIREQKKQQREQQRVQLKEHREQKKELRDLQRELQKELRDQQRELRDQQREMRDQQREEMKIEQRELREHQKAEQLVLMQEQRKELKEKQDLIDQKQMERQQGRDGKSILN